MPAIRRVAGASFTFCLLLCVPMASGCCSMLTSAAFPQGKVRTVAEAPEEVVGARWLGERLEALIAYEDGQQYVLTFAITGGALAQAAPPRPATSEGPEPLLGEGAYGGELPPFAALPPGETLEVGRNPRWLIYRAAGLELSTPLPPVTTTRPPSRLYDVGYGLTMVPAVALDVALTPVYAVALLVAIMAYK